MLMIFSSGTVLKFVQAQIYLSAGFDLRFFVKFTSFPLLKGRQTPLLNSKCNDYEKSERFLVSKVEFHFQVSQWNKKVTRKVSFINSTRNSKSFKGINLLL